MLKWQNDVCQCGLDLTKASPADEVFKRDETGKVVTLWVCPKCGCPNPTIEAEEAPPEAEAAPKEAAPETEGPPKVSGPRTRSRARE